MEVTLKLTTRQRRVLGWLAFIIVFVAVFIGTVTVLNTAQDNAGRHARKCVALTRAGLDCDS